MFSRLTLILHNFSVMHHEDDALQLKEPRT
jgi:hypothetical protein